MKKNRRMPIATGGAAGTAAGTAVAAAASVECFFPRGRGGGGVISFYCAFFNLWTAVAAGAHTRTPLVGIPYISVLAPPLFRSVVMSRNS